MSRDGTKVRAGVGLYIDAGGGKPQILKRRTQRLVVVMITSSGTLVIVRFVPVTVMIHSAVVYASVSSGGKEDHHAVFARVLLPPSF